MADPRYYGYGHSGRSATFVNPATTSLPSIQYSNRYSGDLHVFPVSTSNRYSMSTPRYHHAAAAAPPRAGTSATTYAVNHNPSHNPRSSVRDTSRTRRSTLDSANHRPVIITTTTNSRGHQTGSHASSADRRANSPIRDEYRASDGSFYTQPASSIRGRAAPYSAVMDDEDYSRARDHRVDGILPPGRTDTYRSSRPSVIYHNATVDIDDGYGYTNPSELVRYDLDHGRPRHSRRRESFDRSYYRPNITFNPERASMSITADASRGFANNLSRSFDNRGGPPVTTWAFDRINRYENPQMQIPPPAPVPPAPHLEVPTSPRERRGSGRNSRPVSLYQETPARPQHLEEYYRGLEDERAQRELRDLERESQHNHERGYFQDDSVAGRGFGVRTDVLGDYDDRREHRDRRESRVPHGESSRRADDELERISSREDDFDRERRKSRQPSAKEDRSAGYPAPATIVVQKTQRNGDAIPPPGFNETNVGGASSSLDEQSYRQSKIVRTDNGDDQRRGSKESDDDKERKRFRDKVGAGLGLAASAVGLGPKPDKGDKMDRDTTGSPRRRAPEETRRDDSDDVEIVSSQAADRYRQRDKDPVPRDRRDRKDRVEPAERSPVKDEGDVRDYHRRDAAARLDGGGPSRLTRDSDESDENKPRPRRHRASNAFDPNDAESLRDVKSKLAAMNLSERASAERISDSQTASPRDPVPETALVSTRDEGSRSRDVAVLGHDEKQVRVVSPPRDKSDQKPLRGILKQPSEKFPEDPNPIREGVAPHKKDEKLKEVPSGARWTRISRKIVNPEALTIGKERFEVRDDFVIVLRVLSKEEIQTYAAATQTLRDRRRREAEGDRDRDDDEKRRTRRHRDRADDDDDREDERDRERDKGRHRRHRKERDDDDDDYEEEGRHEHHHRRSHKDRDREGEGEGKR